MQKFRRHRGMRQRENSQKEKCYKSLQIAKIGLNYKLQLLVSEYQKQSPEGVLKNKCS